MSKVDVSAIKLLVLDMDGVMTDGGLYLFSNGMQARKFHAKDGEGIKRLLKTGVKVAILTGSKEKDIVQMRSQMLLISPDLVSLDTSDKLATLKQWAKQEQIGLNEMAYIGDDLPDIEVLQQVGLSACPADAVDQVKAVSDLILTKKGGEGCVRELIDYFLFPA